MLPVPNAPLLKASVVLVVENSDMEDSEAMGLDPAGLGRRGPPIPPPPPLWPPWKGVGALCEVLVAPYPLITSFLLTVRTKVRRNELDLSGKTERGCSSNVVVNSILRTGKM